MNVDILMSCMHQIDDRLVSQSKLTGNVIVINQCDNNGYKEFTTKNGVAKIYSTTDRGLTKSRNIAISKSNADICMLCDDDEVFVDGYETKILDAYEKISQADVIIFNMKDRPNPFGDTIKRLRFPNTMKVSSWQISFKRDSLIKNGVRFDELLGAGTNNGAEEELKFLTDCEKAGLKIYFCPTEIASVAQEESTWWQGFNDQFFINRGATTRYILGWAIASVYALYYAVKKRKYYKDGMTVFRAIKYTFKGIKKNKITKQAKANYLNSKG